MPEAEAGESVNRAVRNPIAELEGSEQSELEWSIAKGDELMQPKVATPQGLEPWTLGLGIRRVDLSTFGSAWQAWQAQHNSCISQRYRNELEARTRRFILPAIGVATPLEMITTGQIRGLTRQINSSGTKRHILVYLSTFFKWANEEELCMHNPTIGIRRPRQGRRTRVLTDMELKAIWSALFHMSPLWRDFYRVLTLTGQRRNEVASISWDELNLQQSTWTIPARKTKNNTTHIVHLSTQAKDILEARPEFIGRHPSGFSKAKARLDKLSGVSDWVVHDLRRTCATGMAKLGHMPHVIELVLNHTPSGLPSVYQHYGYLPERQKALEDWGRYVACQIIT